MLVVELAITEEGGGVDDTAVVLDVTVALDVVEVGVYPRRDWMAG